MENAVYLLTARGDAPQGAIIVCGSVEDRDKLIEAGGVLAIDSLEHALVLLTPFSTNTWNAPAGDIVECESAEEKARLLAAQFGRELEDYEPERRQKIYRMADAHAPIFVPEAKPVAVVPAKRKKAANEDDPEGDDDADPNRVGVDVTGEFFGADKSGLKVFKFGGGFYNVVNSEGKAVHESKIRKAAVVAIVNEAADKANAG